jgi:hypothetical protein
MKYIYVYIIDKIRIYLYIYILTGSSKNVQKLQRGFLRAVHALKSIWEARSRVTPTT